MTWTEFAPDSPLEESGFQPLVPLNLRRRRFSEHLSGLPGLHSARSRTRAERYVSHQPFERLLVDAAQRRHRYLLANPHRSRLGVSGTSGSNPLSCSGESGANLSPGTGTRLGPCPTPRAAARASVCSDNTAWATRARPRVSSPGAAGMVRDRAPPCMNCTPKESTL
jgi:hypothetical protein